MKIERMTIERHLNTGTIVVQGGAFHSQAARADQSHFRIAAHELLYQFMDPDANALRAHRNAPAKPS
jgi:hypothetical protein